MSTSTLSFRSGSRRSRVLRSGLALSGVLLAAPLLAAQPAAAVPGLVTSQRTSAVDSTAQKVVFAPCPVGTHAVGGSAVVGGSTRIQVNTEVPDASGYTVLARELRGGTTADWHVVVTAQCAPAASLPGLEYVRTASAFDSASTHGATAACSPGKRLVGVGGLLDSRGPGQDRLVLTAVRPQPALTSVRVTGAEAEAGYAGPWSATAVAVCTTPRPGHSLATATSAVSSVGFKHAVAACPAGTKVHAGGFDVGSGRGQVRLSTSFLDPDLTADPTRQGFAAQAREDATGTAARWRVASFAICAA